MATILRLWEQWFRMERHAHADSNFSYVTTAEALFARGFRLLKIVKTVNRGFSHMCFREIEADGRASHIQLVSDKPSLILKLFVEVRAGYEC